MNVVPLWPTVLLALAAFRVWRLVAMDKILERPRHALLNALERRWGAGEKASEFLGCPWCCGFWIVGLELAAYIAIFGWFGLWSLLVMWFAISTLVGATASLLALIDRWNG